MKRIKNNYILILFLVILMGIIVILLFKPKTLVSQACMITGDVEENIQLKDFSTNEMINIEVDGDNNKGFLIQDLIIRAKPISDKYDVALVGYDGLYALLQGEQLSGCSLLLTEYGWNTIAKGHPINANIKDLKEIIIIDKSEDINTGVNIISQDTNIANLTPGNLLVNSLVLYPYLDGSTEKDGDKTVSLYKQKKIVPLENYVEEEIEYILVMTYDGKYRYFTESGYIEAENNQINFILPEEREILKEISGIIINPPKESILDTYNDSLHYIEQGERVMLIYIDGFGYHQYEEAISQGVIPNIGKLTHFNKINTVYKPVTNAGFNAMVTGQPPEINGIKDRDQRKPKVNTIFDILEEKGLTHVLIESNIGILDLNTKTIFSVDNNNDGSTDLEVFENAMKELENNPDFILVHFHGVDDSGHTNGDLDIRTMEVLYGVDGYVGKLLDKWQGKTIITTDHGMHQVGDHGDHGVFRYEDMMIPYIIK